MNDRNAELYTGLEDRLREMQAQDFTPTERETLRFLIKVVRSIQGVAWIGGWTIKIAPVFLALWFFGERAVHAAAQLLHAWGR